MQGTVRISASEVIGLEILPPMLASFRERYPGVVVELALTNEVENLLRREADIAVRMVAPAQEALVAKRIGAIRLGLHAHRRYLESHGVPQSVDDLEQHSVIGFGRETPAIRSMLARTQGLERVRFTPPRRQRSGAACCDPGRLRNRRLPGAHRSASPGLGARARERLRPRA